MRVINPGQLLTVTGRSLEREVIHAIFACRDGIGYLPSASDRSRCLLEIPESDSERRLGAHRSCHTSERLD